MKNLNRKIVKVAVSVAKKSVKDDINSTGSPWLFQPKFPQSADKYKKASK